MVDERDADYLPKGKIKEIPTNWDDIPRSNAGGHQSWKRHRKNAVASKERLKMENGFTA